MNCPGCKGVLTRKSVQGIDVDECVQCEGVWFDKDELRKVKDETDSDLNWMDFEVLKHRDKFKTGAPRKKCPTCGVDMDVLNYDESNVEIDFCSQCKGIWLDKTELESIIQYLEKEILIKPLGDYVKATVAEGLEILTGPESFISEWKDFSTIQRFLQYRILCANPELHDGIVKLSKNPFNT